MLCSAADTDTNTDTGTSPGEVFMKNRMTAILLAICTAYGESEPAGAMPVNVSGAGMEDGTVTFGEDLLYERGFGLDLWGD